MKRAIILVACLFIIKSSVQCQVNRYDFSRIPKQLLTNADAVIRLKQMTFTVHSIELAKGKFKYAITILNNDADDYRLIVVPYDKFSKISNIVARYYDEKGELVEYLSNDLIIDIAADYSSMLMSDDRFKYFEFPKYKLPYTIEYEYNFTYTGLLFYPDWSFQPAPNISVEKSGIEYIMPKDMPLRHKEVHIKYPMDSVMTKKNVTYSWQEENLKAYRKEPYSEAFTDKAPLLITAPSRFKMGVYIGDLSSWQSFGKWVYDLNYGRDKLSPEFSKKLIEITKDITDEKEKVIALYRYFQSITRYFNVSLGIGGWQPIEAMQVEKNGYGDCKALTNFMKSILANAGIKSYYTNILAGEDEDIITDFPSQQFNHIVLFVPLKNDSLWLECTSQTVPPGFLGSFTDNRYAMIVTDEGGKLVHTPYYSADQNLISSKAIINIDPMGNAIANLDIRFYGRSFDKVSNFDEIGTIELKKQLKEYLHFPSYSIEESKFESKPEQIPTGLVKLKLNIPNICSKTSSRLIFTPGMLNSFQYVPDSKKDFYVRQAFTQCDTIIYNIPYGYISEYIPEGLKIETKFGWFEGKMEFSKDKLYYYRKIIINKGIISSDESVTDFINKIANFDKQKIILFNELSGENKITSL